MQRRDFLSATAGFLAGAVTGCQVRDMRSVLSSTAGDSNRAGNQAVTLGSDHSGTGTLIPWGRRHYHVASMLNPAGPADPTGATDASAAILAAFDAADGTDAIVDLGSGTYLVSGLNFTAGGGYVGRFTIRSNGATLKLAAGLDPSGSNQRILRISGIADIHFSGTLTFDGNRSAYAFGVGEGTQWHGLQILGCDNVTGDSLLIFKDCVGDGLYLGPNGATMCTHIYLKGRSTNCRRNGCSITGLITGGIEFDGAGTNGTSPQAGIDVEPDTGSGHVVEDLHLVGTTKGNTGHGFVASAGISRSRFDVVTSGNSGYGAHLNNNSGNEFNVISESNTLGGANLTQLSYARGRITARNNTGRGVAVGTGFLGCVFDFITGGNAQEGVIGVTSANAGGGNHIRVTTIGDGTEGRDGLVWSIAGTDIELTTERAGANGALVSGARCKILSGSARLAQHHGIRFRSADGLLANLFAEGNGHAADATYDNIQLDNADRATVTGCKVRQGADVNKPRYGINVVAGTDGAVVEGNDVQDGGSTANLNNAGTSTLLRRNKGYESGPTASRPVGVAAGSEWYDITLNRPIRYDGATWRDATGMAV